MAYLTTRFPDRIAYGATGGVGYNTEVVVNGGGFEKRNITWSVGRGKWDVSQGVKDGDDMAALIAYFRACKGKAHTFPFRDYTDYQCTHANGVLGTGNGTGGPTYQVQKVYSAGGQTEYRDITKPEEVVFDPRRNGSPIVAGAGAGQYSLNAFTGILTMVADAQSNATSITVGATTQVVLTTNPGTLVAGQRLYLSGFTGANAALVNDIAHTINTVTGAGPFTFTLATNTSGATITLGSGLGRKFPQVADALTWAGDFDIPCRFDIDQMQVSIESYRLYSWGQIPIVEVRA
jgi:uncharacterized protein (TIGR02217 family)